MNKLNYISYAIFAVVFQASAIAIAIYCTLSGDYGVGFVSFLMVGGFGQLAWKRAAKYKDR
jgi:Mn2+/Fe2+ NRAMP family transporter